MSLGPGPSAAQGVRTSATSCRWLRLLAVFAVLLLLVSCKSLDFLQAGVEGRDVTMLATYGSDRVDLASLEKVRIKGFRANDFDNPTVKAFIRGYQTGGREQMQGALKRSDVYFPFIQQVFEEKGIPIDLGYLPIVESTFDARAVSWAGAAGLWQFMVGTGRLFQLDQDYWFDDRMDPRRSTVAAALFLKWLYQGFDNWLLALAAYNAGPGTVGAAIKRCNTEDFWELCRSNALPRETMMYVPKFIAATLVAKNPEKYGFPAPDRTTYRDVRTATIEDATDLGVIAQCAGMPVEEIRLLNPSLKQWATPPNRRYGIHLPVNAFDRFAEEFRKIGPEDRVTFRRYRVRVGDSLYAIAARYGIPVNPIAQINRFRNSGSIQAGESIIIPIRGLENAKALDAAATGKGKGKPSVAPVARWKPHVFLHEVQNEETLYEVAVRYGVDVIDLLDWNEMDSPRTLRSGSLIVIRVPGSAVPPGEAK